MPGPALRRRSGWPATLALSLSIGGCAFPLDPLPRTPGSTPVTRAKPAALVPTDTAHDAVLACMAATGILGRHTFAVGPFADSTGKLNAAAPGATGAFLPQGGSASLITHTLARAGARIISTYFGPPPAGITADYAINGIFNSLDFGTPLNADLRVTGIGPTVVAGWASLSLTIQLDHYQTRLNRQISLIERPVRFTELGVGLGRDFTGVLATGMVSIQSQERLQFEALNGPITLGVIDVLIKEFPQLRQACSPHLPATLAATADPWSPALRSPE